MPSNNYPVLIPAANELEATRKHTALVKIAASLNADSLATLANLAAKPGADAKLKQFKGVLASF